MAITRTFWVDDDGSGTTGTVINNAEKTLLYDQIDAALVTTATGAKPNILIVTTTGTIATLPIPTGSGDLVVYMQNGAPAAVHGIAAGLPGQQLTIFQSGGASPMTLAHLSASAGSPTQRLINFATSAPTSLNLGTATYIYDAAGFWHMVAHEQGAWITPPYSAANFTSAGTWTVDAGDVTTMAYRLSGRTLTVTWNLAATTLGTAAAALAIGNGAWGGFSLAGNTVIVPTFAQAPNTNGFALVQATAITLNRLDGANWTAVTNGSFQYGQVSFPVS